MVRPTRPSAPRAAVRGSTGTPGRGVRRQQRAAGPEATRSLPGRSGRSGAVAAVTWRAAVLIVLALLAAAVVLPSLRAYVRQQEQLAQLRAEVAQVRGDVDELNAELARWEDDAYVIAQARERLTYVFPGERPYRVVDPEFVPTVDPVTGEVIPADAGADAAPWFDTLWVSLGGEIGAGE